MKATDFRIGNLVSYDNRVFEIDTLSEEMPTLNTIEFGIGVVGWKDIKPIKLTEQWLIDFGFSKSTAVDNLYVIQIEAGVLDLMPSDIIGYHVYIEDNWICRIEYVHQLQNLYFALTGKELELKNNKS